MKYTELKDKIELIELYVRIKLGQKLSQFNYERHNQEHLRFDMTGNRDGDDGHNENKKIWNLFSDVLDTLDIKKSYNERTISSYPYVFVFHKGGGYLYKTKFDGSYDEPIEEYYTYGTVDIITDLICRIGNFHKVIEIIKKNRIINY